MAGKKTNLPVSAGCFRPRTLLSHGRAQAVVITSGYRLHAPCE